MDWVVNAIIWLFIPIVMIVYGWYMFKYCPNKSYDSSFWGYKTKRSTQNQETWMLANQFCGKLWFILGCITFVFLAVILLIMMLVFKDISGLVTILVIFIECAVLLMPIVPTEELLAKHFEDDK